MMIDFDLHCHCASYSTCASQTLDELIERAKKAGIKTLAITNHDTIQDLNLFQEKCSKAGIALIQETEFGANVNNDIEFVPNYVKVHILGLHLRNEPEKVKATYDVYKGQNKKIKQARNRYLEERFGIIIPAGSLKKEIRRLMLESNSFCSDKEAREFLNSTEMLKIFQVKGPSISETIKMIHELGGIVVLAHPFQGENHFNFTDEQNKAILEYCIRRGIDGVEAFHSDNFKKGKVNYLLDFAKAHSLAYTMGSDRHFKEDKVKGLYFSFDYSKYEDDIETIKKNNYWMRSRWNRNA